jgi:hypothetical protein
MNVKSVFLPPIALAILAIAAPFGNAMALSYTVSGGSVSANSDDGLIINTSLALPQTPYSFSLNDGESKTFSFFNIWTTETYVNADDKVPRDISATLFFSDPLTNATVEGLTFGGSIWWGLAQWGQVVWENPAPTFTAPDGRVFMVDLTDAIFNLGLWGLNEGLCYGATVKACVTQIRTSVPDKGSTAMLLGSAFLVMTCVCRRKVAV